MVGTSTGSGLESLAGVVFIFLHRPCGQRQEADAIAVFQRSHVGIAQGETDDIADAGIVARSSSHPEDVVVAPGDVPCVILCKGVENDVCSGATIVDVTQDVQTVDGQALYDCSNGTDEVVSTASGDNRIDDDIHIGSLVMVVGALMEQFLNDIGKLLRQRLAHL